MKAQYHLQPDFHIKYADMTVATSWMQHNEPLLGGKCNRENCSWYAKQVVAFGACWCRVLMKQVVLLCTQWIASSCVSCRYQVTSRTKVWQHQTRETGDYSFSALCGDPYRGPCSCTAPGLPVLGASGNLSLLWVLSDISFRDDVTLGVFCA